MVAVRPDAATSVRLMVSKHHCLRQLSTNPYHLRVSCLCGQAQHSRSFLCPFRGLKGGRERWQNQQASMAAC